MLDAVSILPPLFMLDALDGCTHPRRWSWERAGRLL